MVKVHARFEAVKLRKEGHSYNYIAPAVGVSKGTLSVWLADVPYTPNSETVERIGKALAASGAVKSRLKRESIQRARIEARSQIRSISKRDMLMIGLGLYIGEGAKSTQVTNFVNSNPAIMNFMIRWFIKALSLKRENIRLRLHLYPDTHETEAIIFWSDITGIPRSQFFKSIIDTRQGKKAIKSGKLPHGTAHLTIHSMGEKRFGVFLARKIMALSDIVLCTQELRD